MQVALVPTSGDAGLLQPLTESGAPAGPAERVGDLAAAVRERESGAGPRGTGAGPRWVWPVTAEVYPGLLRAGGGVARCHDLALTEAVLLGHEGRWGEPRSLSAASARLRGLPVPDDPPARRPDDQPALFEPEHAGPADELARLEMAVAVYARQLERLSAVAEPARLRLLVAAESSGALTAAEMARHGVPWRVDVHDALLTELLGPRPRAGLPPARLRALADQVAEAFGRRVNPDSPAEVQRAFARAGVELRSTRAWELREVDHPAVPPLLEYKELARLYAAHGWGWLSAWVRDGRFRPEYVPGGVVSGRWASRGGGALQIPHAVRRAVVADPGWVLAVADAAQLEPRVLAALSGDQGLADAAGAGDLYEALAAQTSGGDRSRAKTAVLAAMYGAVRGEAGALVTALHARFPASAAAWCGPGSGAPARLRRPAGEPCRPPARIPRPAPPPGARRPALPPTAAGSPATSWCRPAPRTGPSCCSPPSAGGSPG